MVLDLIFVSSNELDKEKNFIAENIKNTKNAYNINIEEENIDLVIFNLGYLPGSDKSIQTNKDTTIKALNNLLPKMNKENMLIIICLYVGHNEGMQESLLVDQFVKDLSPSEFLVTKYQNYNRPSSPFILTISPNKISKK